MFWWGLLIGLSGGCSLGFVACALLTASKRAEQAVQHHLEEKGENESI